MNPKNLTQADVLLVLIVALLALVLRIHHLGYESLFMDELHQISYYPANIVEMPKYAASQQQTPLDYWIGHFISRISDSDFFVRLPAAIFGVGSTILLYLTLIRLTNRSISVVASLIFAISPYQIFFSQYARPYSISIFFFIALLYVLLTCISSIIIDWKKWSILFVTTYFFLISRTLSPFVTVLSVLLMSLTALVFSYFNRKPDRKIRKRIFVICTSILAAFITYLPFLKIVLDSGARYTRGSSDIGIDIWLHGFQHFSLTPILESYITQLEPAGIWLLPLLMLSPFTIPRSKEDEFKIFKIFLVLLLPVVCILNIFVFQAKSDLPFRPPYAIYLAPLCVIIASLSSYELIALFEIKYKRHVAAIGAGLAAVIILQTTLAMIDFKSTRKISDWRGLTDYLQTQHQPDQLYIFDGFTAYGNWEPIFYGFPHYYKSQYSGISMDTLPVIIEKLRKYTFDPIFILFYYRNYYITNHSEYPIIPIPGQGDSYNFDKLENDSKLKIKKFTSFYVVKMRDSGDTSLERTLNLVERVLDDFPDSTALIEWNLAAAALKKFLNQPDWNVYLEKARQLTPENRLEDINQMINHIENN